MITLLFLFCKLIRWFFLKIVGFRFWKQNSNGRFAMYSNLFFFKNFLLVFGNYNLPVIPVNIGITRNTVYCCMVYQCIYQLSEFNTEFLSRIPILFCLNRFFYCLKSITPIRVFDYTVKSMVSTNENFICIILYAFILNSVTA